jgi:hypothetical protein
MNHNSWGGGVITNLNDSYDTGVNVWQTDKVHKDARAGQRLVKGNGHVGQFRSGSCHNSGGYALSPRRARVQSQDIPRGICSRQSSTALDYNWFPFPIIPTVLHTYLWKRQWCATGKTSRHINAVWAAVQNGGFPELAALWVASTAVRHSSPPSIRQYTASSLTQLHFGPSCMLLR